MGLSPTLPDAVREEPRVIRPEIPAPADGADVFVAPVQE
jgi:hypothetical protein